MPDNYYLYSDLAEVWNQLTD